MVSINRNPFKIKISKILTFILLIIPLTCWGQSNELQLNLLPVPQKLTLSVGKYRLTDNFSSVLNEVQTVNNARAMGAINRWMKRLAGRTGIFFKNPTIQTRSIEPNISFRIRFQHNGMIKINEDESYQLTVNHKGIELSAITDIGIIRGLETLIQLLESDDSGYYFPYISIDDAPRFPWRGLLIDSCRHFMPVDVIKRNLDGMAAVKMNVLHWHLTEDQGFRVESKSFPKLHLLGSDGLYYSQEQIRDIINYAADRGIMVMPEFDIPGHSTSWLVGYPELASLPGPYNIERKYGVMDPTFDPTLKQTYRFFKKFFKEVTSLFPCEYIHIGGDENNGEQWNRSTKIQAFKKKHNLADNHALQAYFNRKILKILTQLGKKMVGWDEIFQPELPNSILIHSWRGKKALIAAAKRGYNSILSNGYYIDLVQPTDFHYLNDPVPVDTDLTAEEKKRILGGEATMWAELVSAETVDSRIWPRTAAIAERLWSAAVVNNISDMYRRLDIISIQLEELGLTHIKNREMMYRRLVKSTDTHALQVLIDVIEPLKGYKRHSQAEYTFYSPLTRVVDAASPDAPKARIFSMKVDDFLNDFTNQKLADSLIKDLEIWKENHQQLQPFIAGSPILKEIEPLSDNLSRIAKIGLVAIDCIRTNKTMDSQWLEQSKATLQTAKEPRAHAELMVVTAIEALVNKINTTQLNSL